MDCGLYQGDDEAEQRNWRSFRFRPSELSAVIVTHAHLDHTGLLPRLVKEGFDGPIYCTRASRGLVSLILQDAGHLQEEQARYARKKGYSRHADPKPLYDGDDARETIKLLRRLTFDDLHEIVPGVHIRYRRAGHLLGAGSLEIRAKGSDGERRTWCFSGDVGRYDVPIVKDPEPPLDEPAALVLESTYGDREHRRIDVEERFRTLIKRVFSRGGTVVVPAFALGRSQEVLYHLAQLVDDGDLDARDIFLDSPMAIKATELYAQAKAEHDEELTELIELELNPLGPDRFSRCRSVEQSKSINRRREPSVVVAASGMASGGRVVHHLKRRLGDPANAVVFVGYQASGTLGRALLNGAETVGIHGERIPVRAEILGLHGLSAHADRDELIRWCKDLPAIPERLFLNHGEDPPRKSLAASLAANGFGRATLPAVGDIVPW